MSCVLSDITSDTKLCNQPQHCTYPSEAGQPRRPTGGSQLSPHSGCHAQLIPAHAGLKPRQPPTGLLVLPPALSFEKQQHLLMVLLNGCRVI